MGAAIFGDSEEMLTIGMMGMGLMLVGGVVGGILGFNWGSREAATINRAPRPPQRWISEDRQSLET